MGKRISQKARHITATNQTTRSRNRLKRFSVVSKILVSSGRVLLKVSFVGIKFVAVYLVFSYCCKYPKVIVSIPSKVYVFSKSFFEVFENKCKSLSKTNSFKGLSKKGRKLLYNITDLDAYRDLDDRFTGKFYKIVSLSLGLILFTLYSFGYLSPSPGEDDVEIIHVVSDISNIKENILKTTDH